MNTKNVTINRTTIGGATTGCDSRGPLRATFGRRLLDRFEQPASVAPLRKTAGKSGRPSKQPATRVPVSLRKEITNAKS